MEFKKIKSGKKFIKCTPSELRKMNASDYNEGDIIRCGKYRIHIEYGEFDIPSLKTWIEDALTFKSIDCTPGGRRGFTPYYIDDFKGR